MWVRKDLVNLRIKLKMASRLDQEQIFKQSANDLDKTIAVSGFINSKVGNKITRTAINSTTDDYSYYVDSGATLLYTIRIIFSTSSKEELSSVERIA
jgi:endonuclease III-like uncharacterized protein